MLFRVPPGGEGYLRQTRWSEAYLCGLEGVPWECQVSLQGDLLTLRRGVQTSAKLSITCPLPGIGYRQLTTCSLRSVDRPHELLVELARGSCYRLRVQSDAWQRGGLALSDRFESLLAAGTEKLIDLIQVTYDGHEDHNVETALRTLVDLENAADELGELFADQSLRFRHRSDSPIATMVAATINPAVKTAKGDSADPGDSALIQTLGKAFNAVNVRVDWLDLERGEEAFAAVESIVAAAEGADLRVIAGPLIDLRHGRMPAWALEMQDQPERLIQRTAGAVREIVERFRGRVVLWNVASGLNLNGPLSLDDEQRMQLSVAVLQAVRRADPSVPVLISIDQPDGDYLTGGPGGLSPLHYADSLLRSGLGLAGIGLNYRFGFETCDSAPRSAVDLSASIDRWSTLRAPLLVQLSTVGGEGADTGLEGDLNPRSLLPPAGLGPAEPTAGEASPVRDAAEHQSAYTTPLVRTLLAKPIVHAILYDHLTDQRGHGRPHAGVIDAAGQPRPLYDDFVAMADKFFGNAP